MDYNHTASATKDRTGLFDGQVFKPTPETGKKLLDWLEGGVDEQARAGRQPNLVVVAGQVETDSAAGCGPGETVNPPVLKQATVEHQRQVGCEGGQLHNTREAHTQSAAPAGPNQLAQQPRTANQAPATQAQIRKIFTTAGEARLDETVLHQLIERETGKTSVNDLAKPEASRVIELLLGMASGRPNTKTELAPPSPQAAGGSRMRLF